MSEYYNADMLDPNKMLHIKIKKREYIEVFKVKSFTRKIKIRNKRKFIKQYKIKYNSLIKRDHPFTKYGIIKGDDLYDY